MISRPIYLFRLCFLCFGFLAACKAPPQPGSIPYDLDHPAEIRSLPKPLKEISGIVSLNARKLLCIEDENGEVFVLGRKKDDIRRAVAFGQDHDYEGIALVHDTIFVLKSNGTLFRLTAWETDTPVTQTIRTSLKKEHNTEGLCYDADRHRLLIACKGVAGHGPLERLKAVYAFDLATQRLQEAPVLLLDPDSVAAYLAKHHVKAMHAAVDGSTIPGLELFAPSDLALEPETGNLYLLCSTGKLLLVFNAARALIFAQPLDPAIYPQPEGICFSPFGELLISNEGHGGKASLVVMERMVR